MKNPNYINSSGYYSPTEGKAIDHIIRDERKKAKAERRRIMNYKSYFNESDDSQENALAHFGVLGMKWGVRKDSNSGGSKRQAEIQKKTQGIQKDIDSFKGFENGIFDKNGKPLLTKEDVADIVEGLTTLKNKRIDKINTKYNKKVEAITKDILSFADSKDGISTKQGKIVLSAKDVADIVEGLEKVRDTYI